MTVKVKSGVSTYVFELLGWNRAGQVLFVGENEQRGAQKTFLLQKCVQFPFAIVQPAPVGRIHDPNEAVGRLEVVAPIRPQALLTPDVPNVEVEAAVLQGLDVEAQSGADRAHVFPVELFQNRRFARIIQASESSNRQWVTNLQSPWDLFVIL